MKLHVEFSFKDDSLGTYLGVKVQNQATQKQEEYKACRVSKV